MLYVTNSQNQGGTWHVGSSPMPMPSGRVITFQADGDELAFFIELLMKAGVDIEFLEEN